MKRTHRTLVGSLVLAGAVVAAAAGVAVVSRSEPAAVTGQVVGPNGRPVRGARVSLEGGATARTDAQGRFRLEGERGWVTVHADGWVPRTRAAAVGEPTLVRLVGSLPGTVTFTFGGDVMFGRRFYDSADDGTLHGLLPLGAGVQEHERLLSGIAPLLRGADLTAVNLETPLLEDPWYDPTQPRPARFHPTKDYAFASRPEAARALRELGVDVLDVGNNHLFDALGPGVRSTEAALESAGFARGSGFFGAGQGLGPAWQAAFQQVRGVRVAFVGCTSILGEDQPISYVAGRRKGGAAPCDPEQLRRVVRAASNRADIVVVMVHGGFEYGRDPSAQMRALSDTAVAAGATLVINHHPHVVGGLRAAGGRLTAWTLGNLLFDQTVWPTFDSYVLSVAVRRGRVVGAWAEPIRLEQFRPTGVVGDDARWVTRGALARSQGPWVEDDGSLWLDTEGAVRTGAATPQPGLSRVLSGCAPGSGRDLLWTGDFEPGDLRGTLGSLWNVMESSAYRKVDTDAAHTGRYGALLHRGSANTGDVLLNPEHRVLVQPGDRLTLLVDARARYGAPRPEVRLSWYNDTRGSSQSQTAVTPVVTGNWRTFRVDVKVPPNAVAVQPYVVLPPPSQGVAQLAVDNVALVDWDEPGCDYVDGPARVTRTAAPPLSATPELEPVDVTPQTVSAPAPLPPGPTTLGE